MKKKNILSTMLLTAMLLSGCSFKTGSVDFSKLKIKDISQYSALGYRTGSKKGNNSKKNRNNIKRAVFNKDNIYMSDSPFYLSAMIQDDITDITFDDGSDSSSYPICSYRNYVNFIAFTSGNDDSYKYNGYDYCLINGINGFGNCIGGNYSPDNQTYLLSKSSGKIYDVTEIRGGSMFEGSKIRYLSNGNVFTFSEENGSLNFESNDLLSYYFKDRGFSDEFIDKYGNVILNDNKVYTWKGKTIDSPYKLQKDFVLERIMYHSESEDAYYFLEEDNTFVKHDYQVDIDPNMNTIYVPKDNGSLIWSSSTRKIYRHESQFIAIDIKDSYSYSQKEYAFDCYSNLKGYNIKNTTDESGKTDYSIIETNMKTGEEKALKLKFDGKDIMEIDEVKVDDEGYITVKGYDTSYKKFEGYMDEDGNVTIEQPEDSSLSYHFDAIN